MLKLTNTFDVQASRVDQDWESVRADMHRIKQLLLQRQGAYINMTGDETTLSHSAPHVDAFLQSLPETSAGPSSWSQTLASRNEAIVVPTQVCSHVHPSCIHELTQAHTQWAITSTPHRLDAGMYGASQMSAVHLQPASACVISAQACHPVGSWLLCMLPCSVCQDVCG